MAFKNSCTRIYEDLVGYLKNGNNRKDTNELFTGQWGMLLFVFYYERYFDNTLDVAPELLEKLYDQLDTETENYSVCTGMTGPFWMLQHLQRHGFIQIDYESLSSDLIILAIQQSRYFLSMQNFDFLHGCVGICNFLVENSNNDKVKLHLAEFVQILNTAAVPTEQGLSFPFFYYHTTPASKPGTDAFSLAHGTCAIQILLMKIHQAGVEQTLCEKLIKGSMEFVLHHQNMIKQKGSMFPGYINALSCTSRVSWCYGDLNVAVALWQCGTYLGEQQWTDKAKEILKYNMTRLDKESSGVIDGCLCHGAAGNAAIYLRMADETGDAEMQVCANAWFDMLEGMLQFSSDPENVGLLMYRGADEQWKYQPGLLEGSAGVGLALLSRHTGYVLPWDEFLLLS